MKPEIFQKYELSRILKYLQLSFRENASVCVEWKFLYWKEKKW